MFRRPHPAAPSIGRVLARPAPAPPPERPRTRHDVARLVLQLLGLAGVGALVVAVAAGVITVIAAARSVRELIGIGRPANGNVDWITVGVLSMGALLLTVALTVLARTVHRRSIERSRALWGDDIRLDRAAGRRSGLDERVGHLRRLADRQPPANGSPLPAALTAAVGHGPIDGANFGVAVAAAHDAVLERALPRAVVAGLSVGVSPFKIADTVMIVGASIDVRMWTLSMLGVRPRLRDWWEALAGAGSALLICGQLDQEDAVVARVLVSAAALGVEVTAEAVAELSDFGIGLVDALDERLDGEFDELADVLGDVVEAGSGVALGLAKAAMSLTYGVGRLGADQLSRLVRERGTDLVQATFVASMVYAQVSRTCLLTLVGSRSPLREELEVLPHRAVPLLAHGIGRIARTEVLRYREVLRTRRRTAVSAVKRRASRRPSFGNP